MPGPYVAMVRDNEVDAACGCASVAAPYDSWLPSTPAHVRARGAASASGGSSSRISPTAALGVSEGVKSSGGGGADLLAFVGKRLVIDPI